VDSSPLREGRPALITIDQEMAGVGRADNGDNSLQHNNYNNNNNMQQNNNNNNNNVSNRNIDNVSNGNQIEDNLSDRSFYFILKEKARRKTYCYIFDSNRQSYRSYSEFKSQWDSRVSIRVEMKKELRQDLESLKRFKRTVRWILGRRNPE